MAPFGQADVAAVIRDTGLLVVLGGSSTYAIVDRVGTQVLPGAGSAVGAVRIALTIETGTLIGLVAGALVTINTTQYRAREIRALGDGALTQVLCERV